MMLLGFQDLRCTMGCNHTCLIGPLRIYNRFRIIALRNSDITQLLLLERPRTILTLGGKKGSYRGGEIWNIKY